MVEMLERPLAEFDPDRVSRYTSRRIGEECSGYKVLVEAQSGRILGAHLLGSHAEEIVNIFTLAMCVGMTSRDLKKTLFAYPTLGSDLGYMV